MWISEKDSPEFILRCNGRQYLSFDANFRTVSHEKLEPEIGIAEHRFEIHNDSLGIVIDLYIRFFQGTNLIEKWGVLTNKRSIRSKLTV